CMRATSAARSVPDSWRLSVITVAMLWSESASWTRWSSTATTTSASGKAARTASWTRTTIGFPARSSKGLPGSLVDAKRAGTTTRSMGLLDGMVAVPLADKRGVCAFQVESAGSEQVFCDLPCDALPASSRDYVIGTCEYQSMRVGRGVELPGQPGEREVHHVVADVDDLCVFQPMFAFDCSIGLPLLPPAGDGDIEAQLPDAVVQRCAGLARQHATEDAVRAEKSYCQPVAYIERLGE